MAKEGRRTPSNGVIAPGPSGKAAPRMDQPFDHWLHKQLHAMYDDIASEPLPEDLLKLIDNDAEGATESQPDNGKVESSNREKN